MFQFRSWYHWRLFELCVKKKHGRHPTAYVDPDKEARTNRCWIFQSRSGLCHTAQFNRWVSSHLTRGSNRTANDVTLRCVPIAMLLWKSNKDYVFWVCVSIAFIIQHAIHMRRIGLPGSTKFCHIISQTVRFSGKCYWTQNVWFDFLYNFCLKHFSF